MKKILTMALVGLMMCGGAVSAFAMGPVDVSAEQGMYAKYVWRGMVQTPDAVMQPAVNASLAGFGFGVRGNMDTSNVNNQEWEFSRMDLNVSYGVSAPLVSLGLGFAHYRYPDVDNANTTEVFVTGKANVLFSPSLTIYQDIDKVKGGYWQAGLSHAVPLNPTTNVEVFAGAGLGSKGYIDGYFNVSQTLPTLPDLTGDTSLTDTHIGARVPFHPAPMVTVTPSVNYSTLMGDVKDVEDAMDYDTSAFVWGLTAAFRF